MLLLEPEPLHCALLAFWNPSVCKGLSPPKPVKSKTCDGSINAQTSIQGNKKH